MDTVLHDLRLGIRSLLRHRGFAAVALLTLALGIGANTTIWSVVRAVLLDPLPFAEPERLAAIWKVDLESDAQRDDLPYPNVRDLMSWKKGFEEIAAITNGSPTFTWIRGGEPGRLRGLGVSYNYLRLLGIEPLLGRDFLPGEDRAGADKVAILSHGLWLGRLGGDENVVGTQLTLDGESYTVVGVLPPVYLYPESIEIYTPIESWLGDRVEDRGVSLAKGLARLGRGSSLETGNAEIAALAARLREEYPLANRNADLELRPLPDLILGDLEPPLLVLSLAVGLVLLIACANLASMLLARAASRRRELAVRAALGAGRARLSGQLLTESLVLGIAGGFAGLALAWLALRSLDRLLPADLPRGDAIALDPSVLAFTFGLSLISVLLFGLLPALAAARTEPAAAWGESTGRATPGRRGLYRQHGLVVAEIALGLVVVIGAGLLIQTFYRLRSVDGGFARKGVVMFAVVLPEHPYPTDPQRDDFFRRYLRQLEGLPGVEAAGSFLLPPLHGPVGFDISATLEGQGQEEYEANPLFTYQTVTPGFFDAMGIQLVSGRSFREDEGESANRTVIVDRETAGRFWPGENPIGKRVKLHGPDAPQWPWMTVVGVAENVANHAWTDVSYDLYEPFPRNRFAEWTRHRQFALRTSGDPHALVPLARTALAEIDPALVLEGVKTTGELIAGELAAPRFNMWLMGLFGALSLLLSGVGLYGVMAYSVAGRTRELGIRLALGDQPGRILVRVVGQGLGLLAAGTVVGLAATWASLRLLAGWLGPILYETGGSVPWIAATAVGVAALTTVAASSAPARRAARVDPVVALRHD